MSYIAHNLLGSRVRSKEENPYPGTSPWVWPWETPTEAVVIAVYMHHDGLRGTSLALAVRADNGDIGCVVATECVLPIAPPPS